RSHDTTTPFPTRRSSDLHGGADDKAVQNEKFFPCRRTAEAPKPVDAPAVSVPPFDQSEKGCVYRIYLDGRAVGNNGKPVPVVVEDRKSTRLNSSHQIISY